MRCDRCGKFRKTTDIAMSDHGDQFGNYDYAIECRWCMAPVDRERFNMPIPATVPESTTDTKGTQQ